MGSHLILSPRFRRRPSFSPWREVYPKRCALAEFELSAKFPLPRNLPYPITACFGFIYFRGAAASIGGGADDPTRRLTSLMKKEIGKFHDDDQWCFNCLLADEYRRAGEADVVALGRGHRGDVSDDVPIRTYVRSLEGNSTALKVALLPYSAVLRYCNSKTEKGRRELRNAVVIHCHTKKTGSRKIDSLAENGLLLPNRSQLPEGRLLR